MPHHDIPPPANWEDFEDLCLDLWRLIWADPKARKHGRRGQPQAGVDVYGQPGRGSDWEGVQCKLKSQILGKKLTRKEIQAEVAKAQTFKPDLATFTLATTAPRDTAVEEVVRETSRAQQAAGSFRVSVAFWEDILEEIERLEEDHPGLLIRHHRAWKRLERRAGIVTGLPGVPKLPPHYLKRPEYLEPLKRAILHQVADKLGITGKSAVGVQGMGGIGKTVLAAAVARDGDVRRAFADGVLWVAVGQTPDLVALQAELAAAAGHPEPVFVSVHKGKRELEQLFEGRHTLLVAVDVWTVEAAAAFDVVGAAGRLLITTRNSDVIVGLGAKEHRLDVLEPEQALTFLADWSGQDVRDLPEVAARVAKACGHLPLALAMIGAMVQHRPTGWDDALTRLERADLDWIRREFPDYPYPDLLRSLEASIRALEPEDRDRYLELAVFREDETIPEAALATLWSAADLDDLDTRDLIHRLANRSLAAVVDNGGLKLHDLQRDYVCKRAAGSLTVFHQRLLDAYARRCDDGWPSGPDDGYYFQRLPHHLMRARRFGELRALLLEIHWLRAKLHAAGVAALIADYDLLPGREDLRQVQGALRLAAHALVRHPQQLAGQLLGRLRPDPEAPGLAGLLQGARFSAPATSLLPRTATLMPPGGPLLATLEGHTGSVRAVALLADGRVVSASDDRTVRVWDLETGATVATLEGHTAWVSAVTALADGRVISVSADGTRRLWDPASGTEVTTVEGSEWGYCALAALADGRVVSASNGTVWVRDPTREETIATIKGSRSPAVLAALADGRVVFAAANSDALRVWDPASGQVVATLESLERYCGDVNALTVLTDGRVVSACVHGDGTSYGRSALWLWDLETGQAVTLGSHYGQVTALAALADGRVVSAYRDGALWLWDLETGQAVTLGSHRGAITALAALTDGRVVSASDDNTLRVWDAASRETFEGTCGSVIALATLIDGRAVSASYGEQTLLVWDPASGKVAAILDGHRDTVNALATLADGRVVSGSRDGTLRVWDAASGETIATLGRRRTAVD